MNFYAFIVQKIRKGKKNSFSKVTGLIAVISVSIGLATILISFGIFMGFKKAIQDKLFSFGGHILVRKSSLNQSFQETPLSKNTYLYKNSINIPGVAHIQTFAQKAGILQTKEEVMGVILKGISRDFSKKSFIQNITQGLFISLPPKKPSLDIVISQKIADKLRLKVNDSVAMFFVQDPPRFRKFHISGIYQTGMDEFDERFIFGDLRQVQKLNNWADTLVGGYEIFVEDFERLDSVARNQVFDAMNYDMEIATIKDLHADVFDWLSLVNKNVQIILVLILTVAGFNMTSILLIMIMERTQMIGILKALGATNSKIRNIFVFLGMQLIFRGLFWGNLIGLGFCALQYFFHLIPLDPENYYMNTVPIAWDWGIILLMNLLTFAVISFILLIPTLIIASVRPIKAIRFD